MQDVELLILPGSRIVLPTTVGIDGSGRIVAYRTDSSCQTEEFLLTPMAVPEPGAGGVRRGDPRRRRKSRPLPPLLQTLTTLPEPLLACHKSL
jgi:hypothetical protein